MRRGKAVAVSNTVANIGSTADASVSSNIAFYLSTDSVIDPKTGAYLGQRPVGAITGGATSAAQTKVWIPTTTAPGTYYIAVL
ncbi:MAG: hypothetical protein HY894_07005 [Deltaproteobacteria bacterium]|nr:hypothetical protein [Deltaproteobacteria bacterium]